MAKKVKAEPILRLERRPTSTEPGVFSITFRDKSTFYVFHEIPCAIGGRGFAVHRLGLGELYHVRIGRREEASCECMGFLAHGHCKHVRALTALCASKGEASAKPPSEH